MDMEWTHKETFQKDGHADVLQRKLFPLLLLILVIIIVLACLFLNGMKHKTFQEEFEIIKWFGRGTYGTVAAAVNKIADFHCAIKQVLVPPRKCIEQRRQLMREVHALHNLAHDNIVKFYGAWKENDSLFIAMEPCHEDSLENCFGADKIRDRGGCQRIIQQILNGVSYIHQKGLIHRDLKPSNIFFSLDGKVRIGDFGLVTDPLDRQEYHKTPCGTPLYMSPEQNHGLSYNNKVDIYSLGLIFAELLMASHMSVWGHKENRIMNLRQKIFPPELELKYPQEVLLLKQMLSEDPDKRPELNEIRSRYFGQKMNDEKPCENFSPYKLSCDASNLRQQFMIRTILKYLFMLLQFMKKGQEYSMEKYNEPQSMDID